MTCARAHGATVFSTLSISFKLLMTLAESDQSRRSAASSDFNIRRIESLGRLLADSFYSWPRVRSPVAGAFRFQYPSPFARKRIEYLRTSERVARGSFHFARSTADKWPEYKIRAWVEDRGTARQTR